MANEVRLLEEQERNRGYRLLLDRGRLTQRMESLKSSTLEQAKESAQGFVTKTPYQTAEVISRATGETIVKYVKEEVV